jgi:hypothetical protein
MYQCRNSELVILVETLILALRFAKQALRETVVLAWCRSAYRLKQTGLLNDKDLQDADFRLEMGH